MGRMGSREFWEDGEGGGGRDLRVGVEGADTRLKAREKSSDFREKIDLRLPLAVRSPCD